MFPCRLRRRLFSFSTILLSSSLKTIIIIGISNFLAGVCVGPLKRFVMRRLEWLKQKQQKPNNKSRSKKGRSKQDLIIKHKSW